MAYCSVADVKEYLEITSNADDDLIEDLITRAQKAIEQHTGRVFEASSDTTRYFSVVDDTDGRVLFLDRDLASISSITNGDGTTITSSQYSTRPRNSTPYYQIVLLANSGVVWQYSDDPDEDAIQVSGRWAYSVSAPADIAHACIELAAWYYRNRGPSGESDRPLLADGVWILPSRWPRKVLDALEPYRRHI